MSISESLSGVSTELDKILTQLQNIKGVQDEISAGAANIGPFGSRPGGGKTSKPVSSSGGSFTTPPKAPGSQLSGITPMATGGGGVVPPTVPGQTPMPPTPPGGSRLRNAALLGTAAVATAGYNLTPGIQDVIPFQSIKFGASVLSAGGYNQNYYGQVRALFGGHQTSPFGAMAAANIATMSGQGMGTGNFSTVMRETASTSLIFGMKDMDTASALSNMTSGTMAGRLAQYGIYVSDFQTGDSKGFGNLIDQIWRVHYGSSNRKISLESVAGSIRGGYLGAFVNQVFADDPILREMVIKALLMKAQAQGARLDYKSLGRYGSDGATPMPGAPGTKSAMDFSVSMGNTPENNPAIVQARAEGSRADVIDATADATMSGWRTTTYMAAAINELSEAIASNGGPIVDFFLALKGGIQGAQANGETNTILQILGGLLGGGGIRSILPFSTGGDVIGKAGTSTSDSIPARLSKGEYVINARAAQMLGTDYLDSLNSMGHSFGSGFASPAKAFNRGGSTAGTGISRVVDLARKYSHLRYSSNATVPVNEKGEPTAWGCATSVAWLYKQGAGIDLPHPSLSYGQWKGLTQTVPEGQMQPGDLIFMKNNGPTGVNKQYPVNHVEMYLGPGEVFNGGQGIQSKSSYPPIKDGVKRVTGGGAGVPGASQSSTPVEGAEGNAPVRGPVSSAFMSALTRLGSSPEVTGFGSLSGGAKGLSLGLGKAFSWISAPVFNMGASGVTAASASDSQTGNGTSSPSATEGSSHPAPSPGAGDKWLYDFLVSKGLRGSTLKTLWVIGRRESGGNPNLVAAMDRGKFDYPNVPGDFNPNSEYWRGGRYDVGIFQINSQHLAKVKSQYGDMLTMVDPNNNFEMMKQLSSNFTSWTPWGISGVTSSGFSYIDWSTWSSRWANEWGPKTEARDKEYLGVYDAVNVHGYSEGAYNTHEGLAKLHEGEMVLPASTAEQFRKAMREGSMFQPKSAPNINITLHIDKASDEEAERFARKVRSYMQEHDWFDTVRSR